MTKASKNRRGFLWTVYLRISLLSSSCRPFVELNAPEMPRDWDVFQQVFFLSLTANLVNYDNGTQTCLQKALQRRLNRRLEDVPGWEIAWGPVVWKKNPENANTGPGNSWYVAFHPGLKFEDGTVHPTYLIAIAGTPEESKYVWFYQTFAVNSVVNFNAWVTRGIQNQPDVVPATGIVPGIPYVATGIANPVHVLLTTPAPEGAVGAGTTLIDFVTGVPTSEGTKLITSGHSLGGALAPTLALALVLARVIPAQSTLTYPTAGPSPGNKGFTNLFAETFPACRSAGARSYQGWNLNLVNTLDIIPQAWSVQRRVSSKQNLHNIPSMYGKPALPLVQGLILVGAVHALRSGVFYYPLPSQYFDGPPPSAPPQNVLEFLGIFGSQHEGAYFQETSVPRPTPDESEVPSPGLTQKTEDDIWFNYLIVASFEWAREHAEEAEKEIKAVEGTPEAKTYLDEEE